MVISFKNTTDFKLVSMQTFAVVPVKTLVESKTRLSTVFTYEERSQFTLAMLQDVLEALKASKVDVTVVISSDLTVEKYVYNFGVAFLRETQQGLNPAISQATDWCVEKGAELVLILPADVALVTSKDIDQLITLATGKSIVISPSLNGGTNAFLQTPPGIVSPCFGPDSFKRHLSKALADHVQTKIYASSSIMLDIDSEKDLERLLKAGGKTASQRFLKQVASSRRISHY